jgi:hypothetical protein
VLKQLANIGTIEDLKSASLVSPLSPTLALEYNILNKIAGDILVSSPCQKVSNLNKKEIFCAS